MQLPALLFLYLSYLLPYLTPYHAARAMGGAVGAETRAHATWAHGAQSAIALRSDRRRSPRRGSVARAVTNLLNQNRFCVPPPVPSSWRGVRRRCAFDMCAPTWMSLVMRRPTPWRRRRWSRRGCAVRLRLCSSMPETRTRGQLATGPAQVQADPRIRPEIRRVSDNKVFNQRFGW